MYPFSGSPYGSGHPGQPGSYPRLPSLCNSQSSAVSGLSTFVSPLSSLASNFTPSPQSQVLSHQPFYLSHPPPSLGLSDSELGSPTDPISPQESLLDDGTNSSKNEVSPLFDFPGYAIPPQRSKPPGVMPASSYFTPSFPFPATPGGLSTGNTIPYAPAPPPPPIYSQFADSTLLPVNEASLIGSHGISPYQTLQSCMANRMHPHKSISKLSYDSPRFKLTPERAVPLIKWFDEHKDHPYPTRHEKILVCQTTQLTFTQVSTWFANARRRMKKASSEEDEAKSSSPCSSPGYKNDLSPSASPQEYAAAPTTLSTSSIVHVISADRENMQDLKEYEADESSSKVYWDTTVYSSTLS